MTAVRVCSLTDLKEDVPVGFQVSDVPVVLVRQGEQVYALADICSHAEIALSEGEVTRKGLECWLHGSCFALGHWGAVLTTSIRTGGYLRRDHRR